MLFVVGKHQLAYFSIALTYLPITLHPMTQEQIKDIRDRVVVLRRFL